MGPSQSGILGLAKGVHQFQVGAMCGGRSCGMQSGSFHAVHRGCALACFSVRFGN